MTASPQQGVPELHEQGGDAAGVALARVAQATVDVGVQEELGDGEAVATSPCARGGVSSSDRPRAATCASGPVDPGHGAEGGSGRRHLGCVMAPRVCEEVPQRRQGRGSHDLRLGVVLADPGEQLR